MKVLQLGPYPPPHGGVQSNLVAIRRYLQKQGLRSGVVNITRHRKPPEEEDIYYPKSSLELMSLLIRLPHNILHIHFGGFLMRRNLALFLFLNSLPGRKTILSFHSGGYSTSQGVDPSPASLPGWIFRRFDRIIAVNPQIAQMMLSYGVRQDRIRMIPPHAFDLAEKAAVLPEPVASFFTAHDPLLLTVGLLEPEYDLMLQIHALGQIRERYPKAGLVICGSGSLEAELRAQSAALPWAEDILLAGDVPHGATLRAIEQTRILLRTTRYDGDAISIREALCLGTPVIATDNGMRPSGLRLIPPSNQQRLVEAVFEELGRVEGPRTVSGDGMENVRAVFEVYRELS